METALLTPWWRDRSLPGNLRASGSTTPTRILDWRNHRVQELATHTRREAGGATEPRSLLIAAHRLISERTRPSYSLNETRPISHVLRLGYGSCTQRLALLEGVARSSGIATRAHGLVVDGRFWRSRFPHASVFLPREVLLAWPEFLIDADWVDASRLFWPSGQGCGSTMAFTNAGTETLFDALSNRVIDWHGIPDQAGDASPCDLSAHVVRNLGLFESRDDFHARYGQTLAWPARALLEPILGRSRRSFDGTEGSKSSP